MPSPYPLFDAGRYFDMATELPPGFWSTAWVMATGNVSVVNSPATAAQEMPSVPTATQPPAASYFKVT